MKHPKIDFHIHYPGKVSSRSRKVKDDSDAVRELASLIEESDPADEFAVSIGCWDLNEFPAMHFQVVGKKCFFQVYSTEVDSPDGEEGWLCLTSQTVTGDVDDFLDMNFDEPGKKGFFLVLFAEGVWFSKTLLVTRKRLLNTLNDYSDRQHLAEWFARHRWWNMGL